MAYEIVMPQLGLTMEEGTVERWLKNVGDTVKQGEPLIEIATDKLTNEVMSDFDGVLLSIVVEAGKDAKVKEVLGYIGEAGESVGAAPKQIEAAAEKPAEIVTQKAAPAAVKSSSGRIKASPLAKKTAANMGVDLASVIGTGPNGRIVQRDVIKAAEAAKQQPKVQPAAAPVAAAPAKASIELMEGDKVVKMSSMRKVVAKRMTASAQEIPTVTQTVKVDVTELIAFRAQMNAGREKKISLNDIILKATAAALRANEQMLVSLDGDNIVKRAHVNLGMAVALDDGLIVPVIKDADKLSLEKLSETAADLAKRAREGGLKSEEYQGSTFTISNLGMFGVESFTPIINQPDAAILGVNCIDSELDMDDDGRIFRRKVMRISLTYDHRLLDGAAAAKFEMTLRDLLQNPLEIFI